MQQLTEKLRALELDHTPDGWPAVQMQDITKLLDALVASQSELTELTAQMDALKQDSVRLTSIVSAQAASLNTLPAKLDALDAAVARADSIKGVFLPVTQELAQACQKLSVLHPKRGSGAVELIEVRMARDALDSYKKIQPYLED